MFNKKLALVSGLALSVAFLAGCAVIEGPQPETPKRPELVITVPNPELQPDGSASDNLDYFVYTLKRFVESDIEITASNVVGSLGAAGFDPAQTEVTFDETKTGLRADFIMVSVRFDDRCLIGQVVHKNRELFAEEVAAVGPQKDVCLIGKTSTG